MIEFIAKVIEMTTNSLKEHGLIKTCLAMMGLLVFFGAVVFLGVLAWQAPEIIRALQGR